MFFFILFLGSSSRSIAATATGLDEYVDILQVQQLLLDTSPCTTSTATTSTARPRPRVNVQKAAEYSNQSLSGMLCRFSFA